MKMMVIDPHPTPLKPSLILASCCDQNRQCEQRKYKTLIRVLEKKTCKLIKTFAKIEKEKKRVIKNSPLCCTQEVCFKIQTLFTIKHSIK